jgi:Zn finger protein HypA/HybF involved in hydrogenase expression
MSIDNCQVCEKRLDTDFFEYQVDGTLLCDGCLDELENEQEPVSGGCIHCGYEMSAMQWSNHERCPKCGESRSPVAEPGFTVEQQSSNRFTASQTAGTWIPTDLGGDPWVKPDLDGVTAERDRYKALAGELAESGKLMRDRLGLKMGTAAVEFNAALAKYEKEVRA